MTEIVNGYEYLPSDNGERFIHPLLENVYGYLLDTKEGKRIIWEDSNGKIVDETSLMAMVDMAQGAKEIKIEFASVVEQFEGSVEVDLDNPLGNSTEKINSGC